MRDVIDGAWINRNLPQKRGSKAALARSMGVSTDTLSKILNGLRNVQPTELPGLLNYFGLELTSSNDRSGSIDELLQIAASLNDAGREVLLRQAAALASSPALLEPGAVRASNETASQHPRDGDAP